MVLVKEYPAELMTMIKMSGNDFLAESLEMTLLMRFFEVDLVYCALQQD